jgi:hypothetical protein
MKWHGRPFACRPIFCWLVGAHPKLNAEGRGLAAGPPSPPPAKAEWALCKKFVRKFQPIDRQSHVTFLLIDFV